MNERNNHLNIISPDNIDVLLAHNKTKENERRKKKEEKEPAWMGNGRAYQSQSIVDD